MKAPKIREFNRNDWYMLAGAEKFYECDGASHETMREPLIADGFENIQDMYIVADRNGVQIDFPSMGYFCLDKEDCTDWDWYGAWGFLETIIDDIIHCSAEEAVVELITSDYDFEMAWN